MGERKGTNKYYPPDYNPKVGGLNKFLGTHALRERARKIHLGIIIIRFEMPYNIWCDGCKNHIGMGVRYNAEKTKVGMYYSTPIYQFRMKCHLCNNHFEIKTDPANFDYIIVSGARRQENRWDPHDNGQIVPETKETQMRMIDDAMFRLEHEVKDINAGVAAKPIIEKIFERNLNVWKDPYLVNSALRNAFRNRKKELKLEQEKDNELLARTSLSIKLLPENEEDRKMASLMRLQSRPAQEKEDEVILDILNEPTLPSKNVTSFGGVKRQKLIDTKIKSEQLGIVTKRRNNSKITETVTSTSPEMNDPSDDNSPTQIENETKSNSSTNSNDGTNGSDIEKTILVNGLTKCSKKISLVCDYSSSEDSE